MTPVELLYARACLAFHGCRLVACGGEMWTETFRAALRAARYSGDAPAPTKSTLPAWIDDVLSPALRKFDASGGAALTPREQLAGTVASAALHGRGAVDIPYDQTQFAAEHAVALADAILTFTRGDDNAAD